MKGLSLPSRLMLWVHERFPLANTPLFIILYIASMTVGSSLNSAPENPISNIFIGGLLSISFFLLLRVIDEHKDYKEDCKNHPTRVLQSGKIDLFHLKMLGFICLLLQLTLMLFSLKEAGAALLAWVIMLAWTLLMAKEFFVPRWLNRHFVIYALSHTLIMPFFIWWALNIATPGLTMTAPIVTLMELTFVASLSFEITRKCKGPDEDRAGITTYSLLWGRNKAVITVLALQGVMILLEYHLIKSIIVTPPLWFYIISLVTYLTCIIQLFIFLRRPVIVNRKRNEAVVGLAMLSGYLLIVLSIYLN